METPIPSHQQRTQSRPEAKTIRFLRDLITKFAPQVTWLVHLVSWYLLPTTTALTVDNNRLHTFAEQIAHYLSKALAEVKTNAPNGAAIV